MNRCIECGFEDDEEDDYTTSEGLCLDCASYMNAYNCVPDCRTRARCTNTGLMHNLCGTCETCYKPKHHCVPEYCRGRSINYEEETHD